MRPDRAGRPRRCGVGSRIAESLPVSDAAESDLHLVFLEWAGDPRAAFERTAAGGDEHYHGERRAVALKKELAERFGRATVVTVCGAESWSVGLTPHLRSVGLGAAGGDAADAAAVAWLGADPPTHLVTGSELAPLAWAAARSPSARVEVFPVFASTFFNPPSARSPLRRLRERLGLARYRWRVGRALARLDPAMLMNHNLVATEDLRRLAPRPERVRAYEVMDETPLERARERLLPTDGTLGVFYCGRVSALKGVTDLVEACGTLRRGGLDLRLTICGGGDEAAMSNLAAGCGLGDRFEWLGPSPHAEVERQLERAAVAAVPSRPSCPEGLPLTMMEPLGIGLPVVASDHRVWARLSDGEEVATHRGGDATDLARVLGRVLTEPDLYARLSRNGPTAFRRLRCPEMLADLQRAWADEVLPAARGGSPAS